MVNINYVLRQIQNGNLSVLKDSTELINNKALFLLDSKTHSEKDIMEMGMIIRISNILYNNSDIDILPLEDGVYDLLLELYKTYNPAYQVGAEPVIFTESTHIMNEKKISINPIQRIDADKVDDFLFYNNIITGPDLNRKDLLKRPIVRSYNDNISRRVVNIKHQYPELVGTLDKCKFVLNSVAVQSGVFNDTNVKIFERDFIASHILNGYYSNTDIIRGILELKYDGISVESTVSNRVLSARTRGDANEDIAADITPILQDYPFVHAKNVQDHEAFGMKFEAIMTYNNLVKYNQIRNKDYKNCRTAISSIFSSSDGYKYRDLITLVPLATSLDLDRIVEVEFMNKYYRSNEILRYTIIEGNYNQIIYQVKRFKEEAEFMRQYMPFMYDGIVFSYLDKDLRKRLGRVNAVNKYSIAIKFNPLSKLTTFRGYTYTVGQDGSITPMIHYDPVEFYGTIHTKSSGHSYHRFKNLGLRIGDVLSVVYVNDVMPYVYKDDNSNNASNPNPIVPFIEYCPSCNTKLVPSASGKTMICPNVECPERNINRMISMMQKLNLKDFSEAYLTQIAKKNLYELLNITYDELIQKGLGELTSRKFIDRMNELKTKSIYDYKIIGSLGFTNIGVRKWKLILNKFTLSELLGMESEQLQYSLMNIKGVGPVTAEIIAKEFEFFRNDLLTINTMNNIIITKGLKTGKVIRFSGVRDKQLIEQLSDMGHDITEGSVTLKTDILLIPNETYTSPKTKKASENENTSIVVIDDFIKNMDKYLK